MKTLYSIYLDTKEIWFKDIFLVNNPFLLKFCEKEIIIHYLDFCFTAGAKTISISGPYCDKKLVDVVESKLNYYPGVEIKFLDSDLDDKSEVYISDLNIPFIQDRKILSREVSSGPSNLHENLNLFHPLNSLKDYYYLSMFFIKDEEILNTSLYNTGNSSNYLGENVSVDDSSTLERTCLIGDRVSIGADSCVINSIVSSDCVIRSCSKLKDTIILDSHHFLNNISLKDAIVAKGCVYYIKEDRTVSLYSNVFLNQKLEHLKVTKNYPYYIACVAIIALLSFITGEGFNYSNQRSISSTQKGLR